MTTDGQTLFPRFLAAFIGFAAILGVTFLAMHHWHAERLEAELFTPILERELEILLDEPERADAGHWPGESGIYGMAFDALPGAFADLAPGQHEVHDAGRTYQVLVRDMPAGRYVLAYDQTRSEARETRLLILSFLLVALALIVATVFGILTYRHAISPVRSLARQVRALDGGNANRPLETQYRHSEIRSIAAAIDAYRERIAGFIDREREFSANVSHELRTPLSVIQGAAELLRLPGFPQEKKKDAVRRIEHACQQMSELIRALLVIAREQRLGPQSVPPDCCQVDRVAEQLVRSRQGRAREKGIELAIPHKCILTVHADPGLVASVIGNVVDNALEHTEEGHVYVSIEPEIVTVTDTGAGVEEADMPYLFHRHFRSAADSGTSNGIGLSIVQRICEHYGWEVTATSSPGTGTTVRIRFQAAA